MQENFITCNKYIPLCTKNINLDFSSKYKVAKSSDNGMLASTITGPGV
jgi:hypothetical protein